MVRMIVARAVTALFYAGCRRVASVTPAPMQLDEDHCWWAVLRSTELPDTLASRFQRAFTKVGLNDVRSTRSGDTVWVVTSPDGAERPLRRSDVLEPRHCVLAR
jgi:hypothetical protein